MDADAIAGPEMLGSQSGMLLLLSAAVWSTIAERRRVLSNRGLPDPVVDTTGIEGSQLHSEPTQSCGRIILGGG
jgi:hypothetical protein